MGAGDSALGRPCPMARNKAPDPRQIGEEPLRRFMEAATETFGLFDRDLNVISLNPASQKALGVRQKDVRGRNICEIAPIVKESGRSEKYRQVIETGKTFTDEVKIRRQDGKCIQYSITAFRVGDGLGLITRNMTKRREAEDALHESEQRFLDIAEAASEWIWETDADHRITFISDRINECGSKESALDRPLGRNDSIVVPDSAAWKQHRINCDAHLPFKNFEYQVRDQAGEIRTCRISGKPVFNGDGEFAGYRGVGLDVTEKKQAEAAAERSQRLFAAAFHNSPGMNSLIDAKNRKIVDVNEAWCKVLGYSREEAVGRTIPELGIWVDPTHKDAVNAELNSSGRVSGHETQIRTRDGRVLHVIIYSEILDLDGESLLLTVNYDQTERKNAEEALRDSERRFRTIAAIASDWIWETGPDHRFTLAAGRSGAIDIPKDAKLTGPRLLGKVLDGRSKPWRQHVADIKAHRPFKNYVDTYRDKAGEVRVIQSSGEPFFGEDGAFAGYRGTSVDLTEIKHSEDALNESRDRLTDMLAIARDAIIVVDANLTINTFNKGAENIFG